jgi:hypothetical protein
MPNHDPLQRKTQAKSKQWTPFLGTGEITRDRNEHEIFREDKIKFFLLTQDRNDCTMFGPIKSMDTTSIPNKGLTIKINQPIRQPRTAHLSQALEDNKMRKKGQ